MKWHRQAGFTLIELIIVLAVMGLIIAPLGTIIYQSITVPRVSSDTLMLLHSVRQAARYIADDARQTTAFTAGAQPDYGTLGWVDRTGSTLTTYAVRYYYSSADARLMREETVDAASQTRAISDNIQNYSDVSLQQTGDLLLVSVTATMESLRGTITRTASVKAQMRRVLPTTVPTPPPYTLAWDDFESGGWTGGSGWLDDLYHAGDSSIVTTDNPYEGSYHLRLRQATGYVDRALDLTGQTNVRLQFWAKANSFEAGETASMLVSSNGTTWYTVRTWVDGEDDNIYRFYDFDLSSYSMTSEFWIAFDAQMSDTGDYFWVDDLKIVRTW